MNEHRTETPEAPVDFVYTSKDVFFATVGQMNVHPTPIAPYPYVSEWRNQGYVNHGRVEGWSYEGLYAVRPEHVRVHMNTSN